ncbi:MAG: Methylenetetrahydrofolate reductase [Lentisphaerae bacterium ADurb.Bin242]|nr:MAG: Methylenetetrahydrofolate reductase [Lentisphaerae bacterium ADurb.Bin242]
MEIPAVKHSADKLQERLNRFAERYRRIVEAGHGVCLTDNAMGNLAFQGHELIRELGLPVPSGRVMVHINTFHTRKELHEIVDSCAEMGVGELLVVSGDGSARLPKLKPSDLEADVPGITSVELLAYLRRQYKDIFRYGAVFNQYEPPEHEKEKLRRKLEAGAEFIITQPVLPGDPEIGELRRTLPVPLFLEVWMSPKIDLLSQCVGRKIGISSYDPLESLENMHRTYPECPAYLAMVDFKTQFDQLARSGEKTA